MGQEGETDSAERGSEGIVDRRRSDKEEGNHLANNLMWIGKKTMANRIFEKSKYLSGLFKRTEIINNRIRTWAKLRTMHLFMFTRSTCGMSLCTDEIKAH